MNASEIMRASIAKVSEDTPFLDAVRILLETNQRALPVVDKDEAIVGILCESDLMNCVEPGTSFKSILGSMAALFSGARHREIEALTVRNLMTPNPVCVGEEESLEEIVDLMSRYGVAQVPVTSGCFVIGIVTRTELLACLERRLRQGDSAAEAPVAAGRHVA